MPRGTARRREARAATDTAGLLRRGAFCPAFFSNRPMREVLTLTPHVGRNYCYRLSVIINVITYAALAATIEEDT